VFYIYPTFCPALLIRWSWADLQHPIPMHFDDIMTVFPNIFSIQVRLRQIIKYCNSSISSLCHSKMLCLWCRSTTAIGASVSTFIAIVIIITVCCFCACCPLYKYRNKGTVYTSGKYTSHYYNAASKHKLQSIKVCRNQVCRKKELVSSRALIKRK